MYTILLNQDKQLIQTTRVALYEGETNSTKLRFLVPSVLNDIDMNGYRAIVRYELPNGKKYIVNLLREDMYKDYYSFTMNISQNFTETPGYVSYTLTLIRTESETQSTIFKSNEDYIEIRKREDKEMEAANLVWEADVSLFPRPGESDSLYIDIGANKVYRWDEASSNYIVVGSDYMDITEIEDS